MTEELIKAIEENDINKVKQLIEKGADVNASGEWGLVFDNDFYIPKQGLTWEDAMLEVLTGQIPTYLMIAAEKGCEDICKCLIENGAMVNKDDDNGRTALMYAAKEGHANTVKMLIENGANVHAKDKYGATALINAAQKGHKDVVDYLIFKGADVNGEVLISALSTENNNEVINLLINANKDILNEREHYNEMFLQAAVNKYTDIEKKLIEKGADVNIRGAGGNTALIEAAKNGDIEIVKALIAAGADVNVKDKYGDTALMYAVGRGHFEIVELLIEYESDVNAKDELGFTALMRAAESGQIDMVKFLIRKGADICARTESDETALMLAVRGGHINIVKLLIEKSADVEVKDHFETWIRIPGGGLYKKKKTYIDACNNEGETALIYALKEVQSEKLERKQAEIVKLLIEEGANVNAKDHWGRPALTILLQFENSRFVKDISLVKLFVEYGADVNAVGGYGETALKEAARAGYWDVCKYLVDYGADVNFVGYLGLAGKAIDYARNPDVIDLLKYKMKENTNKK